MTTDARALIEDGDTALGIEFGSTRIKAVLIGPDHQVLASGSHGWESHLDDGLWSYSLDEVRAGLRSAYASLVDDVRDEYGLTPTTYGSIGVSGMMHGYLAFNAEGRQLAQFRTWRNTNTAEAAAELSELFGVNIPLRWSVAHLHQTICSGETHVMRVASINTLAGWVHEQLTGRHVLGVGDASGMFPIDPATGSYDARCLSAYANLVDRLVPWDLAKLLPTVLSAGDDAGALTEEGALLIDPTGALRPGIPMCPPEGDAGTGMVATNAVAPKSGNISCGTSVFLMVVLEKALDNLHLEIDMVTTPDGSPVAMVHSNNGSSEIDAWVSLFVEFARLAGTEVPVSTAYDLLYRNAMTGDADGGGLLAYNTLSGEPLLGLESARPLFTHTPDAAFTLANAFRVQLMTVFAPMRVGVDVLRGEGVVLERLFAHGGLFKTPGVAQQILADSLGIPTTVGETAGEGGAWGIAVLARYAADSHGLSLPDYLASRVFTEERAATCEPTAEGVAGYERFLESYRSGLGAVRAISHD